jgi:hypothetical protein
VPKPTLHRWQIRSSLGVIDHLPVSIGSLMLLHLRCTIWKACYLCVMLRFWKNCHYLYLNCKMFCNYILKLYYSKLPFLILSILFRLFDFLTLNDFFQVQFQVLHSLRHIYKCNKRKGLDVNLFQFIILDMQTCTKWKVCYLCVMLRFWKNCHYLYLNCKMFYNYILKLYYFMSLCKIFCIIFLLLHLYILSEWIKN